MSVIKESEDPGYKRLFELETEYRAPRVADRLHAIVSFSYLFDDFPNPTIINSGFLKLADYFSGSNNTQRHAILQVFTRAERHMKKIMNVEEVIRRISPQLQSNDPLSRALTLRAFGTMAVIVSDRIDVYHRVIHSLDSLEAMEVSAAIYAADRIGAHSQRFCAIISGKLAFMVRDEKTPLPVRRRLIRIFGHMFEDITLARLARKTCLDILELTQDTEYIVAILRTLTRLASHSLVDVPEQIELLLQQAEDQSALSTGTRRVSLMCLGSLAQRGIEFSPAQIKSMERFLIKLWTPLKDGSQQLSQEESNQSAIVLRYWLVLALEEESGIEKLLKTVLGWMEDYKDLSLILSKAVLNVAQEQPKLVFRLQDVIMSLLECRVDSPDTKTFIVIYRALLESLSLNRHSLPGGVDAFEARISSLLERFGEVNIEEQPTRNHWELYQLGRYSLQTGWPSLAMAAFKNLERGLRSVPHALWLSTVQTLALIESSLQTISSALVVGSRRGSEDSETSHLEGAVDLYSHQQMYVKIIGYLEEIEANQAINRSFQVKLCSLRWEYLQTCQQALTTLHLLASSVTNYNNRILNSGSTSTSSLLFVPLPSDERGLYQCADRLNQLAHQYTLLRAQIAVQDTNPHPSSSSSTAISALNTSNGTGSENVTSVSIVTGESTHSVPKLSSNQQSDEAIEILQTMCLVLAYSFQKLGKVLSRTADGVSEDEDNDEIFDIDPLLIPLLYEQDQDQDIDVDGFGSGLNMNGPRTLTEVFRSSTRKTLGFVDQHMKGSGTETLETSLSLVQQLIVQLISFPVPVPQMFFVSYNYAPIQSQ
ncbi:hypothetical protein FBU30_001740 [Linnemannia zychae]|nr:hypothetical protein FBU30_001740 [Linnemannia zychae]